jgi:hypothetical protein
VVCIEAEHWSHGPAGGKVSGSATQIRVECMGRRPSRLDRGTGVMNEISVVQISLGQSNVGI